MTFERLGNNAEFQKVYRAGKTRANKYLVMVVQKGCEGPSRYGFSVSKKVGNSVMRHHVTRYFREAVRKYDAQVYSGNRIIIIAKPEVKDLDLDGVCRALVRLYKTHRIWKEQSE